MNASLVFEAWVAGTPINPATLGANLNVSMGGGNGRRACSRLKPSTFAVDKVHAR